MLCTQKNNYRKATFAKLNYNICNEQATKDVLHLSDHVIIFLTNFSMQNEDFK